MMRIEPTKHTPLVFVDPSKTKVVIAGVCIPENAYMFFKPLEEQLMTFDPDQIPEVQFQFRLEFMNTLSSKAFLDFIRMVKDQKQIPVRVIWEYFHDDEEMKEHGETYSEIMDIPFEFRSVDPAERFPKL